MKRDKREEIKNMTDAELTNKIASLTDQLFKMRNDMAIGRIEKPHLISESKKTIARCQTVLRERKSGKK